MTIALRDVSLAYRSDVEAVIALDKVSLTIDQGDFVAVLGASGSGKTSLLNVIAGLQVPDSGSVVVGGQNVDELDESERAHLRLTEVGVIFQDNNLIPEFSAIENVMLPLRARGLATATSRQQALEALHQVGLEGVDGRTPSQLSGGQKQRVGIARALVGGRTTLLADEPTGSLDSENSRAVFQLLRALADDGVTVIVATHDPLVEDRARRVAVMRDGQLSVPERKLAKKLDIAK